MSQSMLAIKNKLGSSSNSLRAYSAARGLTAPDSMLEFDTWLNGPAPPPPPPPPTYYSFSLGYDVGDAGTACNATRTTYYSTCSTLANSCVLRTSSGGAFAADGYYSNGSTVYYVEGNGYINTTSACPASPPPPPPPATVYYDYVKCAGAGAYESPIFTVQITGDAPSSLTITGACFSPLNGISYSGTANYPVRAYTATGCACD